MGYHADVYDGIESLLVTALPSSVPVFNALTVSEVELERFATCVCILRESVDYERHPEVNPSTSVKDQGETWSWALYVRGGGGASRSGDRGAAVDTILETIQTALNARRPTTTCGPLHLVSEDFQDRDDTTVTYVQRWTHLRRG